MPYINKQLRKKIHDETNHRINYRNITTSGELNYAITTIIWSYYSRGGPGYSYISDVVGSLQCALLEFYRRVAEPYEHQKIKENGDVYYT